MNTWILVAHRSGAELFERARAGEPLALVRRIEHPEGRLRDGDIDTDRAGVGRGSARPRAGVLSRDESPHEHLAQAFARELASYLDEARMQGRFAHLVLVAEPRFMGTVRGALSPSCAKLVDRSVLKELNGLAEKELRERLVELLDAGDAA